MKTKFKRITLFLLSALLVICLWPSAVFAADEGSGGVSAFDGAKESVFKEWGYGEAPSPAVLKASWDEGEGPAGTGAFAAFLGIPGITYDIYLAHGDNIVDDEIALELTDKGSGAPIAGVTYETIQTNEGVTEITPEGVATIDLANTHITDGPPQISVLINEVPTYTIRIQEVSMFNLSAAGAGDVWFADCRDIGKDIGSLNSQGWAAFDLTDNTKLVGGSVSFVTNAYDTLRFALDPVTGQSGSVTVDGVPKTLLTTTTATSYKYWVAESLEAKVYDVNIAFEASTYTVTYDANGGSGIMTAGTATYGEEFTLATNIFIPPAGKVFAGWATSQANANAGTIAYADGYKFEPWNRTEGLGLYAVWVPTYTVTFKVVNGTWTDGGGDLDISETYIQGDDPLMPEDFPEAIPLTEGTYRTGVWFPAKPGAEGLPVTSDLVYTITFVEVFDLTIADVGTDGTTSDTYAAGESVVLDAGTTPAGKRFWRWESSNGGKFGNVNSKATTFTMPANATTVTAIWEDAPTNANSYTLHLNPQLSGATMVAYGATVLASSKPITQGVKYGALPTPKRDGYKFSGWVNSAGAKVNANTKHTVAQNTTLYGTWAPNKYTVTFNGNGGKFGKAASVKCVTQIAPVSADALVLTQYTQPSTAQMGTLVRAGYVFDGWWTTKADTAKVKGVQVIDKNGSPTNITNFKNHTLFARWAGAEYTIVFDPKGGTFAEFGGSDLDETDDVIGKFTQTFNTPWPSDPGDLPVAVPTAGAKVFKGWSLANPANGNGAIIDGKAWNKSPPAGSTVTLYAQWTDTLNVKYLGNGAKNPKDKTVKVNAATYGALAKVTRAGYDFAGWYDKNDCGYNSTTNVYTPITGKDPITATTAVKPAQHAFYALTLVAHWTPKAYTVKFNKNAPQAVHNTAAGPGVAYDKQGVLNITGIDHNSALGSNWPVAATRIDKATKSGKVTYTEYVLVGWFDKKSGGKKVDETTIITKNNMTFFAQWAAKEKTITLNANGGNYGLDAKKKAIKSINVDGKVYGMPYGELEAPTVDKANSAFTGWFLGKTKIKSTDTITFPAAKQTLKAMWTPKTKTVTLDANGGKVNGANTQTIQRVWGEAYGELPQPAYPNHHPTLNFLGWYTTKAPTAKVPGVQVTDNTILTNSGNHKLFARWTADPTFKIIYDSNYNVGITPPDDDILIEGPFLYGAKIAALSNTFENDGFRFVKWNTARDGLGASYVPGNAASGTITMSDSNVTLYAIWEPVYEVTIEANGASGELGAGFYGDGDTVSIYAGKKPGYDFAGWESDPAVTFADDSSDVTTFTMIDEDVEVEATWTPTVYAINYALAGGAWAEGNAGPTTYTIATIPELKIPVRAGQTFNGWRVAYSNPGMPNPAGAVLNYVIPAGTTGDITLTATWKARAYDSLEVTTNPTIMVYAVGETLSFAGMVVNAVYDNGEKVLVTNYTTSKLTGYKFTEDDAGTFEITVSHKIGNVTKTAILEVTVAANYMFYDGNGGVIAGAETPTLYKDPAPYLSGAEVTVLSNDVIGFANTGYKFIEWNTEDDGDGDPYAAGEFYTMPDNADATLYAIWEAMSDDEKVTADKALILDGTYVMPYATSLFEQTAKTAWVQDEIDKLILFSDSAVVSFATEVYSVELTLNSASDTFAITVTVAEMMNIDKLAADKALIEAGTYAIPYANQTNQTTKTAWVQNAVNTLIVYDTVAVVTFDTDTYSVALTNGAADGTATITVTEAAMTSADKLAADKALIEAGTYAIPYASQTDQTAKTEWVQGAVDDLIVYDTVADVTFDTGTYEVALTNGAESGSATITVTLADPSGTPPGIGELARAVAVNLYTLGEANKTVDVSLGTDDFAATGLTIGNLTVEEDYTFSGTTITLLNDYLKTLTVEGSPYSLTVTFNNMNSTTTTITIMVTDTTPTLLGYFTTGAGTTVLNFDVTVPSGTLEEEALDALPKAGYAVYDDDSSFAVTIAWVIGDDFDGADEAVNKYTGTVSGPDGYTAKVNGTVTVAEMTDAEKLAADKALIEAGTYEIPYANQTDQPTKTAWVQGAVTALIENDTVAVVTFETDAYKVALTNGAADGTATITVTMGAMTAVDKLAADKALIEAGTYEIPFANQTDQTTKTTWVQGAVNALIVNDTVAVVTFETDAYEVALTNGDAEGTATIMVTLGAMTAVDKLAADKTLIEAGTYEIPYANQNDQPAKTAWVQGAVNALIVNDTIAVVTFDTDAYSVALTNGAAVGTATITVTLAAMTDVDIVAAARTLIETGTYEMPYETSLLEQVAMTAWVKTVVDGLIVDNGSTAEVIFIEDTTYEIVLEYNEVSDTFRITVTVAEMTDGDKVAADMELIQGGTYEMPYAISLREQSEKTTWVQDEIDELNLYSNAVVIFASGIYSVMLTLNLVTESFDIQVNVADMTDVDKVAADMDLILDGSYEMPYATSLLEQDAKIAWVQDAVDNRILYGYAVVSFEEGDYLVELTLNSVSEKFSITVIVAEMPDVDKVAADKVLITNGTYAIPYATSLLGQTAMTAWVQGAVDGLIANGTTAAVSFTTGMTYEVVLTLNAASDTFTITASVAGMTDVDKVAADKVLITGGTYAIPYATSQIDQAAMTAWVQNAVDELIDNGTTAAVSFTTGMTYEVVLTLNGTSDTFTITATVAAMTDADKVAVGKALITGATLAMPYATSLQGEVEMTAWVKTVVDGLIVDNGSTAEVIFITDTTYEIVLEYNEVSDTFWITVVVADMTDGDKVAADMELIQDGTYEMPYATSLFEQGAKIAWVQDEIDKLNLYSNAVVSFVIDTYYVELTLNLVTETFDIQVTVADMTDVDKVAADMDLILDGSYEMPYATSLLEQDAKIAWVQDAVDMRILYGYAVVSFEEGDYLVELTLNSVSEKFSITVIVAEMPDVDKVAADKVLIEAGTYEIPFADQTNQTTKTAWVQSEISKMTLFSATAAVSYDSGVYSVELTLNGASDTFAITVTEALPTGTPPSIADGAVAVDLDTIGSDDKTVAVSLGTGDFFAYGIWSIWAYEEDSPYALVVDIGYTYDDGVITLKNAYLKGLDVGTVELTVIFDNIQETTATITITVTGTAEPVVLDKYVVDDQGGDEELVFEIDDAAYGTTAEQASDMLPTAGFALMSDGTYIAVTFTWTLDGMFDGDYGGISSYICVVAGEGYSDTELIGTVTIEAAPPVLLGYFYNSEGSKDLDRYVTVPWGTQEREALQALPEVGIAVYSDGDYFSVMIEWTFDEAFVGTTAEKVNAATGAVTGHGTHTGVIDGTVMIGEAPPPSATITDLGRVIKINFYDTALFVEEWKEFLTITVGEVELGSSDFSVSPVEEGKGGIFLTVAVIESDYITIEFDDMGEIGPVTFIVRWEEDA